MSPIPANIVGWVIAKRLIDITVADGAEIPVSIAKLKSGLAAAATTSTLSPTYLFEPADTKVARLGTFATNIERSDYLVTLEDATSEHAFLLVYVDRPCVLKGGANDVVFKRRGLHWLRSDLPLGANPVIQLVDPPLAIAYTLTQLQH